MSGTEPIDVVIPDRANVCIIVNGMAVVRGDVEQVQVDFPKDQPGYVTLSVRMLVKSEDMREALAQISSQR